MAVTILLAALPPCLLWASRRRWQFTRRHVLIAVAVLTAALAWSYNDLVLIRKPQDLFPLDSLAVSWRLRDSSPCETTAVVFVLSLLYTFAVQSRAGLQGNAVRLPGDGSDDQEDVSANDPRTAGPKACVRWFHPTPNRLLIALLVAEGTLLLAEQFRWFSFTRHKGWSALIAVAGVSTAILLVALFWWVTPLVFRRWFQISIRSLVMLLVVIGIPCGWLAVEMRKAERQRVAVAAIKNLGGTVYYGRDEGAAQKERWSPLGIDYFCDVAEVWYRNSTSIHDVFDWGEELKTLTTLTLYGRQITDTELENFRGLSHLQRLTLDRTAVTDEGMKHLNDLEDLEYLDLRFSPVTGENLEDLKCLRNLVQLDLTGSNVTDAALRHLEGATNLFYLTLSGTQVTDAGVKKLKQALPDCKIIWEPLAKDEPQSATKLDSAGG